MFAGQNYRDFDYFFPPIQFGFLFGHEGERKGKYMHMEDIVLQEYIVEYIGLQGEMGE